MLESISCNANCTCQMFLSNQCTWGGVPRGSELLLHSLFHDANGEVVLMEDSYHAVETPAVEPFPVHLLVLLVSHFSGHHGLLLATLHLWGHPSVQGVTEMKRVMNISLNDNVYWNWNAIKDFSPNNALPMYHNSRTCKPTSEFL